MEAVIALAIGVMTSAGVWLGLRPRSFPVLIGLFWWNPSPMLVIFALLAAPSAWQAFKHRATAPAYYQVTSAKRWEWAFYYFTLLGYLAVMTHDVHALLRPHH